MEFYPGAGVAWRYYARVSIWMCQWSRVPARADPNRFIKQVNIAIPHILQTSFSWPKIYIYIFNSPLIDKWVYCRPPFTLTNDQCTWWWEEGGGGHDRPATVRYRFVRIIHMPRRLEHQALVLRRRRWARYCLRLRYWCENGKSAKASTPQYCTLLKVRIKNLRQNLFYHRAVLLK